MEGVKKMGLGLMNKKAQLCTIQNTTDPEGFVSSLLVVLADLRVFVESRHGSERWANLASFSEATDLFRFRKYPILKLLQSITFYTTTTSITSCQLRM